MYIHVYIYYTYNCSQLHAYLTLYSMYNIIQCFSQLILQSILLWSHVLCCSVLPILSCAGLLPHVILGGDLNCLPETGAVRPFAPYQYCVLCCFVQFIMLHFWDIWIIHHVIYIQGAVASEWGGHSDHSVMSGLDQEDFCGRWQVTMVIGRHLRRPHCERLPSRRWIT